MALLRAIIMNAPDWLLLAIASVLFATVCFIHRGLAKSSPGDTIVPKMIAHHLKIPKTSLTGNRDSYLVALTTVRGIHLTSAVLRRAMTMLQILMLWVLSLGLFVGLMIVAWSM